MERNGRSFAGWAGEVRQRVGRENDGAGLASKLVDPPLRIRGQGQLKEGGKNILCMCSETVGGVTQSRERRDRGEPEPPRARARTKEQERGRRQAGGIRPTDCHHQMPKQRISPPHVRNRSWPCRRQTGSG